jgi:uncharacterized protein (TIGR02996 family)
MESLDMASSAAPVLASPRPEMLVFFEEIKTHPDDDTPRLVFADWLQEHGDAATAARGELMGLQVRRCRVHDDDPQWHALKRREGQLLRQHLFGWLGAWMDTARYWKFERGLIHLEMRAEKFLATETVSLASSPQAFWIESLTLTDLTARQLEQVADSPLLPHLSTLDLGNNQIRDGLRPLVRSPRITRLVRLLLGSNRLGEQGIIPLTEAGCRLDNLAVLNLELNWLSDDAAERLARAPHLARLSALHVGHNRIGPRGMEALREQFGERVRL